MCSLSVAQVSMRIQKQYYEWLLINPENKEAPRKKENILKILKSIFRCPVPHQSLAFSHVFNTSTFLGMTAFSLVGSLSKIYQNPTQLSEIKSNIIRLRSYPYNQNALLFLQDIVWMLIIAFTAFCLIFVDIPWTPLLICSSLKERTMLYACLYPT